MTMSEQKTLVEYGESIDILVTPVEECGVLGVAYTDNVAFSFERANRDLYALGLMVAA